MKFQTAPRAFLAALALLIFWSGAVAAQSTVEALHKELKGKYPKLEGTYFELTTNNALSGNWIFATPENVWGKSQKELLYSNAGILQFCNANEDCQGNGQPGLCALSPVTQNGSFQQPTKICHSHSQRFLEEYYNAIVNAQNTVDLVYLGWPDGRFETVIVNALNHVAQSEHAIVVRILAGVPSDTKPWWDVVGFLNRVKRGIANPAKSKLIVQAAQLGTWSGPKILHMSWTHSKILLVDDTSVMVGGHNLVDGPYLSVDPTFDLSIKIEGGAAQSSRKYVDELWRLVREKYAKGERNIGLMKNVYCYSLWESSSEIQSNCKFTPKHAPRPVNGNISVLAVAAPGKPFISSDANPSRDALMSLIKSANKSIKFSQQDLNWGRAGEPPAMLAPLMRRALQGLNVTWISTNQDAPHGMTADLSIRQTASLMMQTAMQFKDEFGGEQKVREKLCQQVSVATIRFNRTEKVWSHSGKPFGNHAKSYIVDDQLFYVGSDNVYLSRLKVPPFPALAWGDLQEYGLIVDDKPATTEFLREYYDKMWDFSKEAAVSGNEVPIDRCIFMTLNWRNV